MNYEIIYGYYGTGQIHMWDGIGRQYKMYTGGNEQRSTKENEGWLYRFDGINVVKVGHWRAKPISLS